MNLRIDVPRVSRVPAVWAVLLAAGGIFALTMGARQSLGLFLGALNTQTGLGVAQISLAFAIGQICWGLTQPFAGLIADRSGPGKVLAFGLLMVAVGTALIPHMQSAWGLNLAIGVLAAGGAGLAGPSVLMAATTRLIPEARRGMATGIVNAGGSFGQFLFVPMAQGITALAGWAVALQSLAALCLVGLPAAWVLRTRRLSPAGPAPAEGSEPKPAASPAEEGIASLLKRALSERNFQLLCGGFFVCGFHVAFLATHLPGVVASCQLPAEVGAWSLAVVGLFNIVGSFGIGWAIGFRGGRWRMKSLLSLIYATRGLALLVFVFTPKSTVGMLIFAAVMGLTFLSTVPPTAGLVARFFGAHRMGTMFGVVMLAHQIGGFLGAWLGGKAFELRGDYSWMFYADAVLALGASLLHLPITEARPLPSRSAAAGA
jgi:sugar phosphate permease